MKNPFYMALNQSMLASYLFFLNFFPCDGLFLTAKDIYSLLFLNNTKTLADGHFPTGLSSKKKLKHYSTRERCCNVSLLNYQVVLFSCFIIIKQLSVT